jgi:hypothetical protein
VPELVGYRCIERRAEHSEAIYVAIGEPTLTSARARGAKDAPAAIACAARARERLGSLAASRSCINLSEAVSHVNHRNENSPSHIARGKNYTIPRPVH